MYGNFFNYFLFVLPRIDEYKDKIRGVLKGRLPPDKDLKKEITQALRWLWLLLFYIMMCYDDLNMCS